MTKLLLTALTTLMIFISCNHATGQEVTEAELLRHIRYLSSDELRGRLTGSPGDSLAAEYIRKELASYGFVPLSGDGMQRFEVTEKIVPGDNNLLSVDGHALSAGSDFIPFAFSANAAHESDIFFAGYGFDIDTDSLHWDDYGDADIKGKWVMILRGDPEADLSNSIFIPFSSDRDKAMVAKDKGAAGVLLVSGPLFDPEDSFEELSTSDFSTGIPAFHIRREVAAIILKESGNTLSELEKKINDTRRPVSFHTESVIRGSAEIIREQAGTRNVVMMLPGEDDDLSNEYIIMGAHFDHLGMGGPGSSSRALDTIGIHHGADDNASGVAMMLELAEMFASHEGDNRRSIICIAFSGEEEGLLGSKHYVDNPGIDLSRVNAMINMDMTGRLNESQNLQVAGAGTADGLRDILLTESDTSEVRLVVSEEGYGPSDHSSFYGKEIPVLFYSTGAHMDYHTPLDTWDKINYKGMIQISDMIYSVTSYLACTEELLQFREAGPPASPGRHVRRGNITLGIMPDFAGVVKNGLRADFVTPGRPAALGGMIKGDIIKFINGKPVNNIQDYMFRMNQFESGQTITVEVARDGESVVLLIQL